MAVIEAIATVYLEADAASVTFSSLGSYEHLQLRASCNRTGSEDPTNFQMFFNSDTGTTYSRAYMEGRASTATANVQASTASVNVGLVTGMDGGATYYAPNIVDILDYRNGSKNTTVLWTGGHINATTDSVAIFGWQLWDNVAAVTTILVQPQTGSFGRGSEFTLYGLNSS